MRGAVAGYRKLTRTSGKKSSKLILLQLYKKLLKNSVTHSTVIWHLKQIGKTKKLNKWVPHELTENPQNRHFEESSSLILLNNGPFLNQTVMGNKRRVLHDNWQWPAQWLDRGEAPKHFPKLSLQQTEVRDTVRCLLSVWSAVTFWIPAKPSPLRNLLSKSMRRTENRNACSRHWPQKGPNSSPQQRPISPADYHFFKHLDNFFCRENTSTISRRKKILSKSSSNPKPQIFHYRNKQTYFSLAKMSLIVMVPILINNQVFESNDNDLKSMVQNHNYLCTDNVYLLCSP